MQGQISLEKKLRALHLSLVGVYKINIIPPLGEKVRFIPRQAVVWQTKFVIIKISYWEFSIYIKKKKKLQICIYFQKNKKKTLNQNESLDKMRAKLQWWNCLTHSLRNEKHEANNGNNR